jgi:Right handed beta helix region
MLVMKSTLMMLALLFSCFTFSSTARADGFRSYISPSGSDNRPCTRTQPCRTFDGAMAKTDEGGEVIALETSAYDPATVTKSITLTAAPGADVVIKAATGNGVTISPMHSATVVLRGLKIVGPGKAAGTFGVMVDPENIGLGLSIENCLITDFGVGIKALQVNSAQVLVSDSVLRNNTTGALIRIGGVELMGAAFTRTRFERNAVGLQVGTGREVSVKDSVATANGSGFLATSGSITILNSMASKNGTGIDTEGFGSITIGYSIVTGNSVGFAAHGSIRSMGNNMVEGNDLDLAASPNITIITAR